MAIQIIVIRANYIKAKIKNMQQYSKYKLCNEKDKITNHIISECNNLAQKEYKTWHD